MLFSFLFVESKGCRRILVCCQEVSNFFFDDHDVRVSFCTPRLILWHLTSNRY